MGLIKYKIKNLFEGREDDGQKENVYDDTEIFLDPLRRSDNSPKRNRLRRCCLLAMVPDPRCLVSTPGLLQKEVHSSDKGRDFLPILKVIFYEDCTSYSTLSTLVVIFFHKGRFYAGSFYFFRLCAKLKQSRTYAVET